MNNDMNPATGGPCMSTSTREYPSTRRRFDRANLIDLTRIKLEFAAAAALLAVTGACGGNGIPNSIDDDSDLATGPLTVIPLATEARIDLPGKVSVFLQVQRADGSPAAGLAESRFKIYENGEPVSRSESQQQLRPRPQVFRSYTHLIMDRSNSVQQNQATIDAQKDGAVEYVRLVTQEPENFIKISWFDGQQNLHAIAGHDIGFTNDRLALEAAIADLDAEPPFSPSTNLYGAVIHALDDLDDIDAEAALEGIENRSLSLVTFTDGTHQAGPVATFQQARARVMQSDGGRRKYSAFTIGLGTEIDQPVLEALGPDGAEFASDLSQLIPKFQAIGAGVRALANSFYFLSYCSPKTIGTHVLRVSVQDSPGPEDATFDFDASYFGAGCGFLDVYSHPVLTGSNTRFVVSDVIEDDQGRVVACGWRTDACDAPGCSDLAGGFIARFQADPVAPDPLDRRDGRLDLGFGNGGIVLLADPVHSVTGASALVRNGATGELLVGGWSRLQPLSGTSQAVVWRVSDDGTSVQRVEVPNTANVDQVIHDIALEPSGRLIACGSIGSTQRASAVWALHQDLTLDVSFDTDGLLIHPAAPVSDGDVATELVLAPSGRIYVVGEGFAPGAPVWNGSRDLKVLAIEPTAGTLDLAFSQDGVAYGLNTFLGVPLPGRPSAARLDALERLTVGGTLLELVAGGLVRQQPGLWRFQVDGAADLTFTGSVGSRYPASGVVTLRTGSTSNPDIDFGRDAGIDGLHVHSTGALLASGWRSNAEGHTDLAMFAFRSSGVPSSAYNVVGFLVEDGSAADNSWESGRALLVHSTGAIWTLGSSAPPTTGMPPQQGDDVPTLWIDRDPTRVFAPLGSQ